MKKVKPTPHPKAENRLDRLPLSPSHIGFDHESGEAPAPSLSAPARDTTARSRGFSLLEMIGVLAILAVLAAVLFPAWIRRIDMATKKQESASLLVVSNALTLHTLRSGAVPTVSDWTNSVGAWSMLPASRTVANSRRYARYYFTQPSASSAVNGVTARPTNVRAVVVSMLGGDALDASTLPDPFTDAEFNYLWETQDGSRPASGMLASWNGSGDDLLIQRIDYAPLFHRLVLVNRDTNNASFRINDGNATTVALSSPNSGHTAYYLDGTAVSLCNAAGGPMAKLLLKRDLGFVFEAGMWRDQIMGPAPDSSSLPDDFAAKAAVFLEADWNTGGKGSDQQGVLTAMYSFMYTYTLWANQRPHFPKHSAPSDTQVPEYEMLHDVAANGSGFLYNLSDVLLNK